MKAKKINSKLQPVKMIHLLIDNNGTHQQALLGSQPTATIDCSSSCNYKKQSLTYRNNGIQKKNSNSVFREQNPIGDPHQNCPSVIKDAFLVY